MAAHLYTIIEGIHARMAELPAEKKTDDTILPILFEQIAAEYQKLRDREDEAKRHLQEQIDAITKREKARDISKLSHRPAMFRNLRKERRDLKARKFARDNDRRTKRREFEEQQNLGEEAPYQQPEQDARSQAEGDLGDQAAQDAFVESMREARAAAIREQAEAEQLEKDEALRQQAAEKRDTLRRQMDDEEIARRYNDEEQELRGYEPASDPWGEFCQEMVDEATRAEEEEAKEPQARRRTQGQQAEDVLEVLHQRLSDEETTRRYTQGDDGESEEEEMEGVPLPGILLPDHGVQVFPDHEPLSQPTSAHNQAEEELSQPEEESFEGDYPDPWGEFCQEIIAEATLREEEEEAALRKILEQQAEELEALQQQMNDEEIERRFREADEAEVFEGVPLPGVLNPDDEGVPLFSDAEVQEREKAEALRKQQDEVMEAIGREFDDDEPARRWNEAEAEEQEGVPLHGVSISEDDGVPLFSQPAREIPASTKQHSDSLSSQEESSSDADSSGRSRSSTASSATSTDTAVEPDTKPTATLAPDQSIPTTKESNPKQPQADQQPGCSFKLDKSQPQGSRYPVLALHGYKRNRGTQIAEEHIAKRRVPRTTTSIDAHASMMPEVCHLQREDVLNHMYRGAYFNLQEGDSTGTGRKVYLRLGRDHDALVAYDNEGEIEKTQDGDKMLLTKPIVSMDDIEVENNNIKPTTAAFTNAEYNKTIIITSNTAPKFNFRLTLLAKTGVWAMNKHAAMEMDKVEQIWGQGLKMLVRECGWGMADGVGREEVKMPGWVMPVHV